MHDFIHCAVEGAAGLESGFWGRLASSYAGVGFSLAQDQSSGSTTARVTPTGKSPAVSFTGSTSAPLRVQLSDGTNNWRCNITASPVTIPYGSFNTRCFDATPDGTAYAKQAITALQLTVPGGAAAQPYNISLTSVTENPFWRRSVGTIPHGGAARRPNIVGVGKGRFPPALLLVASVVAVVLGSAAGGRALTAPHAPRLVPVPLISQASPWTCGPAALMAVLVYFGVFDDAESRLDAELAATPQDGTRVRDIVTVARRFGLVADARTVLELDDLKNELARGAVVIVALQAWAPGAVTDWRSHWEDGHYVVVVGVSDDRVYFMDPSVRTGYAYLPRAEFVDRWHDYDVEGGRKVVWNRLGIVIRGGAGLGRYPAEPAPVQ